VVVARRRRWVQWSRKDRRGTGAHMIEMPDVVGDVVRSVGLSTAMKAAGVVTGLLPIPQPMLLVGPGSSARLGRTLAGFGHRRILIVTDPVVAKLGLLKGLTAALKKGGADFVVFDAVTADAPIPVIEKGVRFLPRPNCDAILAFRRRSPMDRARVGDEVRPRRGAPREHPSAGVAARHQVGAPRRVVGQLGNGPRPGVDVVGGHEQPGVADDLREAGCVGGDHRAASRHRLEDRDEPRKETRQVPLLVVDGDDDRHLPRNGSRSRHNR